jgi:hypothetical protein
MTGYCDYCGYMYVVQSGDMCYARELGVEPHEYMRYDIGCICSACVQTCGECGSEYESEEDMWQCCPPDEDEPDGELHYYSFRPALKFWILRGDVPTWSRYARSGELYMGLEIEIEKARQHVHQLVNDDPKEDWFDPNFYYWKSDGSLGIQGAEMVTMPATLEAHCAVFPFDKLELLHEKGARAWGYQTCGMHIHVSRTAFTAPHMWKFIKFQAYNSGKLARIAGRDSDQWASWLREEVDENARRHMTARGDAHL